MPTDSLNHVVSGVSSVQTDYYRIAIISSIVAIVVGIIAILTNEKLKNWVVKTFSFLQKKNEIANYFESKVPHSTEIEVLVYQFGLRATLPVMDWFYLEYINYLSSNVKIKKLVIFPTIDKSRASQSQNDFQNFSKNINKVIKNIPVEIVDPHNDNYFNKEDLVSDEFISTLKYLGSREYFDFLHREYSVSINSIADFNQYRPEDDKIKDIYTHIYKSWGIVNYIKKHIDLTEPVNISAIFWEWEADKIGVLKQFSNSIDNITLFPILGKTQMLNDTTPVPVYIEKDAICIFDENKNIIETALKFKSHINKYNSILEAVLKNYVETLDKKQLTKDGKSEWTSYKTSFKNADNEMTSVSNDFYYFLGLVLKIKLQIKNGNK